MRARSSGCNTHNPPALPPSPQPQLPRAAGSGRPAGWRADRGVRRLGASGTGAGRQQAEGRGRGDRPGSASPNVTVHGRVRLRIEPAGVRPPPPTRRHACNAAQATVVCEWFATAQEDVGVMRLCHRNRHTAADTAHPVCPLFGTIAAFFFPAAAIILRNGRLVRHKRSMLCGWRGRGAQQALARSRRQERGVGKARTFRAVGKQHVAASVEILPKAVLLVRAGGPISCQLVNKKGGAAAPATALEDIDVVCVSGAARSALHSLA